MKARQFLLPGIAMIALIIFGFIESQIQWKNINNDNDFSYRLENKKSIETYREYYDSGKLKCVSTCRGVVPHGTLTKYYENGEVELIRYYENGKLTGEETSYYPNGAVCHIKHYKSGKEDGKQEYFNKKGELTESYIVIDGKRKQHIKNESNIN